MNLPQQFGNIDIYLFDQLLKGRISPGQRVLDAGCGNGRNLVYLLQNGFDICAVDYSPDAIARVRELALQFAPDLPASNFRVENIESLSFENDSFDVVISSAVLHFASDEPHFFAMLMEMWRVLRTGGLFFCRLASGIGIEQRLHHIHGRRYILPDHTERFLVDEEMLLSIAEKFNGTLIEPIKTVNVQNIRCMTTWCMIKNQPSPAVGL
jgi:tellurite methyltransferase